MGKKRVSKELKELIETITPIEIADEVATTDDVQKTIDDAPKLTWALDKGAGILHIDAPGYKGIIQVYVNGERQKFTTAIDQKKSIQLSGLPTGNELFIKVVKLN